MTLPSDRPTLAAPNSGRRLRLAAGALVLLGAVAVVTLLGLALGSRALPLAEVLAALGGNDVGDASIIVWDQRLPRTLLGLLVGAALGMGGAVAQSLTSNPLADPGLLGVSAGAALAAAGGAVHGAGHPLAAARGGRHRRIRHR